MFRTIAVGLLLLSAAAARAQDGKDKAPAPGMKIEGKLTAEDPKDTAPPQQHRQVHTFKLEAGKTYSINMESPDFDAYLRLESPEGKQLGVNDDRGDGTLHSRIIFKVEKTGEYKVIATTLNGKTGKYSLSVEPAQGAVAALGLIQTEFQNAMQGLQKEFAAAKTQEEKDRVLARFFEMSLNNVERYAKIVTDFPKDPVAKQAQQMVQMSLAQVSGADSPAIVAKLRVMAEKGTTLEIRAQAGLSLGNSLRTQSEKAYGKKDKATAEKLQKEAEAAFVAVQQQAKSQPQLATQAEDALFELRTLSIGKVAPEIEGEDIQGTKFKLSDYRGKVVVLDFWGHW